MVYTADTSYEVPNLDLLTFLFDSDVCATKEDAVVHVDANEPSFKITKAETRTLTRRIAYGLRQSYGIGASGPGKDIVIGISTGQHLLPAAFYGVIAANGVYSAASSSFTAAELARQVKDGPAKVIICSSDVKDVTVEAAKLAGLPLDRVLVLESKPTPKLQSIHGGIDGLPQKELNWERITDPKELKSSLICLLYSSGTTGPPKGVLISHMNLVAESFLPTQNSRRYYNTQYGERPYKLRTLAHLPTAHVAGVVGYFVNPFYDDGVVFWMPKFDFVKFLEYNKKYQITMFFTVPPIYLLIAKAPLVTDQFDTLQYAVSGAAPLGKDLQAAASKKLGQGQTFVNQTWGMSETTGSVTVMPPGQVDDTGSISPLIANNRIRLVDEDEKDVKEGQPGEILVQGPVVTNGYHNNPKADAESFVDGWMRTGDIAEVRDGKFYIVDRKKELIKYKGLQIAPAELEALLLSHPLIADAAVIGVQVAENEVPRAYVVADSSKISEEQIKSFVASNASAYKQLRGGVVFLDAIPKSPSGKILRKELRAMAQRENKAKL